MMRLDLFLVEKGYFKSRNKAHDEIIKGAIKINGKVIKKPSFICEDTDLIEIDDNLTLKYVSRGGLKLEGAINSFKLDFKDKVILDIGSSTGGFVDCALKHGAKLVYAVDVGDNQLDDSLRDDKRIKLFENTNILDTNFDIKFDFVTMDVSFVSIEYLLNGILKYIKDDTTFITLIKPQFELNNMKFKNGIVKDKKLHLKVLNNVSNALLNSGLGIYDLILSPIKGGDGNIEFLALVKKGLGKNIDFDKFIRSL
jgi:23S rRNA (cytidine1920-2'-O)/16S rRNA (cytidine1409-2'-O)-methyltransferase